MKIVIGIATYNEKQNLVPLIEKIDRLVPGVHLLFVDDGSPDGTGDHRWSGYHALVV